MADFAPSADSSASPASRVSHSQEEPPFSLRERHAAGTPLAAPHQFIEQGKQGPRQADQRQCGEVEPAGQGVFPRVKDTARKLPLEHVHNIVRVSGDIEHDQPHPDQQEHEQKAGQTVSAVEAAGRASPEQEQYAGDYGEGQGQRPLDQCCRPRKQKSQRKPDGSFRPDPAPVETDQGEDDSCGEQQIRIRRLGQSHNEKGCQCQQAGSEGCAAIVSGGAGQQPDRADIQHGGRELCRGKKSSG